MMKQCLCAAAGSAALLVGVPHVGAAGIAPASRADVPHGAGTLVTRVHSVDEARDTLEDRGYYNIYCERASLPYSFRACKRGRLFHIHINWYGDFVEVDELGRCNGDRNYDDDDHRYRGHHRHSRDD